MCRTESFLMRAFLELLLKDSLNPLLSFIEFFFALHEGRKNKTALRVVLVLNSLSNFVIVKDSRSKTNNRNVNQKEGLLIEIGGELGQCNVFLMYCIYIYMLIQFKC